MEKEKKSKLRKLLEEGCIAAFFTQKGYFLKIYPVFTIDKVKFSFANKENKKLDFDIYMDVDKFEDLCGQILSGMLERKIVADTGDFPGAWKMVTGANGSKEIAIGKGKNGLVIQGRDKNTSDDAKTGKNAFVPISDMAEFRTMAKWYGRVSKSYYENMTDVLLGAMKANEKWYASYTETDDDVPNAKDEPVQEAPTSEPTTNIIHLKTVSRIFPLEKVEGAYAVKVTDDTGKEFVIYLLPEKIGKKEKEFVNNATISTDISISCGVAEQEGKKFLCNIA